MWREMVDPYKTRLCRCSVFQLQCILGSSHNEANKSFACYNGNYFYCQRKNPKQNEHNSDKNKKKLTAVD